MGLSLVVFLSGIRTIRPVLADMLRRIYAADYTPAVPSITTRLGEEIRRLRDQGRSVPGIAQELGVYERRFPSAGRLNPYHPDQQHLRRRQGHLAALWPVGHERGVLRRRQAHRLGKL